jgi:hypothetical protein
MRGWKLLLLSVPLLAGLLIGCGSGGGDANKSNTKESKPDPDAKKPDAETAKEIKLGKDTVSVKGRVLFDGNAADMKVEEHTPNKDADICKGGNIHKGGFYGKDGGVQDVVVYLGGKFAVPKEAIKDQDPFVIGQPVCMFEPRVVVLGPKQNVKIKNDAKVMPGQSIGHDAKIAGQRSNKNLGTIQVGGEQTADIDPEEGPQSLTCAVHDWMKGYIWKLKHPYIAKSNEDGTFEIKDVPVTEEGEYDIMVWHEKGFEGKRKKIGTLKVEKGKEAKIADVKIK